MISRFVRSFSTISKTSVPLINTSEFLNRTPNLKEECQKAADAFHKYGCLIIRDPRVNESHNSEFVDLMEKYFHTRGQQFYNKQPVEDIFPELGYQTGATPEFIEKARNHCDLMKQFKGEDKPMSECPPVYDAKWRFFWRIGDKPLGDRMIDPPKTIPKDFANWEPTMDRWGHLMLNSCLTVAEMVAIGLDLPQKSFVERMQGGTHLLAPTGSDLERYKKGTLFAGFHYDLNFLTIHGKSRFPGLFIWLRNGEKMPVSVPDGCLLLQAGKQIEMLTGGYIPAGYHEVAYTDKTHEAHLKAKANNKITWRVSSTLFSHIRHDVDLQPLGRFSTEEARKQYPPIQAYDQVMEELKAIGLVQE